MSPSGVEGYCLAMFGLVVTLCTRLVLSVDELPMPPHCRYCEYVYASCASDDVSCCALQRLENDTIRQPMYDCVFTMLISNKTETNYELPSDLLFIKSVWMITKCPYEMTNITLKKLCESRDSPDNNNIKTVVPVTDSVIHYKNQFCAECNGVNVSDKLKDWESEIVCDADLTSSRNFLPILKRRKCNIFFRPPENIPVEQCMKEWAYIEGCGQTAHFNNESGGIDMSCNAAIGQFDVINYMYMCFTCNNTEYTSYLEVSFCSSHGESFITEISPPFTAILDLGAISKTNDVTEKGECDTATQLADKITMTCRDIMCQKDRYLLNEECVEGIAAQYHNYDCEFYLFFVKFTPLSFPENRISFTLDTLNKKSFQTSLQLFFANLLSAPSENAIIGFQVYYYSPAVIEYLIVKFAIHVRLLHEVDDDVVSLIYYNVHNINITLYNFKFSARISVYELNSLNPSMLIEPMPNSMPAIFLHEVWLNTPIFSNLPINDCFNLVHALDRCPFITILLEESQIHIEGEFLYFEGSQSQIALSKGDYRTEENAVDICVTEYRKIQGILMAQTVIEKSKAKNTLPAKQLLAFFCICLSIICLLLTFCIYLSFSVLRSQPGVNNMILCFCLFLAQTMYQFGAGQTTVPSWACTLIGGICHFLWLSVMFSMNICSVEMFQVFRKIRLLPSTYSVTRTIRNVSYVVAGSLLFVIVNIFISLSISQGQDTGYGGTICYLSSATAHMLTFVLPSAILLLSNIMLFLIVVMRINNTLIRSQNLNQERNYLAVYMRLSTITGLTWVFGYLHLLFSFEALEYVFIVLNASQGVFIMIAFVANKRVLSLFCKKKLSTSTDTHTVEMSPSTQQKFDNRSSVK